MKGAIATLLTTVAAQVSSSSNHDPAKNAKENGLYYLLEAESKITHR
jgi:hypothetical protein